MKYIVLLFGLISVFVLYAAAAQDEHRGESDEVTVIMNPLLFASEEALRHAESFGYERRQVRGSNGVCITLELLAVVSLDVIRGLSSLDKQVRDKVLSPVVKRKQNRVSELPL